MIGTLWQRFSGPRWALMAALALAVGTLSVTPASAQYYRHHPGHWWWNGRAYVWVYDPAPPVVYAPPPVVYAPPPPPVYYAPPVYAYPSFNVVIGGRRHW
ncbi:MAG TPA: hypothetical protein VMU85_13165 [Stellaceae bacterium]|nr:hypothetical protein [Stellaceae bacterium]